MRGLYESGLDAKDVRELLRVVDWMMALPPTLSQAFWREFTKIQEEKRMPYISPPELVGRWDGMRKGIKAMLKVRFGEAGLALMPEIEEICEEEKLQAILDLLGTATSLDEVRGLWLPWLPS